MKKIKYIILMFLIVKTTCAIATIDVIIHNPSEKQIVVTNCLAELRYIKPNSFAKINCLSQIQIFSVLHVNDETLTRLHPCDMEGEIKSRFRAGRYGDSLMAGLLEASGTYIVYPTNPDSDKQSVRSKETIIAKQIN